MAHWLRFLLIPVLLLAAPVLAEPPKLQQGSFVYRFPSEHVETLFVCDDGSYVLTWGIHNYPLVQEGSAWAHPQRVRCRSETVCSGNLRIIRPNGVGNQSGRATAARRAMPDYIHSMSRRFTWVNTPGPVNAARRAKACNTPSEWRYLPK